MEIKTILIIGFGSIGRRHLKIIKNGWKWGEPSRHILNKVKAIAMNFS